MVKQDFQSYLLNELKDPQMAIEFIRDAMEAPGEGNDDIGYLMRALSQVAKAHGIADLADNTGIGRSTLYSMLSEDSNPSIKNVAKILSALGLKFSVEPLEEQEKVASALDVAEYIINQSSRRMRETTFWLQKLVYYAQVIHLVNFRTPLFFEAIEAWENGPVVRELYNQHRGIRYLNVSLKFGDESKLTRHQKQCIEWALEKYGSSTGEVLSELTHSEDPWKRARGSEGGSLRHITHEMILEYYLNRPDYSECEQ